MNDFMNDYLDDKSLTMLTIGLGVGCLVMCFIFKCCCK